MNNFSPSRVLAGMLCLLFATTSTNVLAQSDVPSVTKVFAVTGATVVTAPGKTLENATVVVRNGVIESVGTNVSIPYDAKIIKGDSLFVYSGFIDGLGYIGIPEPRNAAAGQGGNQREPGVNPAAPSDERAGIQPQLAAENFLDNADKAIEAYRKAGIAIAHVVPRGRMLPGSGAIVALGSDVTTELLRTDVSMFMQFASARGVYPGTPMGIMAKYRNLYKQAELEKKWETNYASNPTGLQRPPFNPVHEAFFNVIDRKQPVVMLANDVLTTYRALRLQKELGFDLILAGQDQASEMIQDLAAAKVKILLSLKLPDEVKSDKKGDDKELTYNPDLRTATSADVEKEAANLKARKMETYKKYVATAASLEDAGVSFAFSTADLDSKDFRGNLMKMIAAGLSEDGALAALTTTPAAILKIDKTTGTIEKGKMGNLVVSSGSYFKEKSFVQYAIVDGALFEFDAPAKKPKKSEKGEDTGANAFAGTWRYLVEIEGNDYGGELVLSSSGGNYSGTITGDQVPQAPIKDASMTGDALSFGFSVPEIGNLTVTMRVTGDSGSAVFDLPALGSFPASLKRTSGPN